jgi:hypothetical protein
MAYKEIDLKALRTYSAARRASKVVTDAEGKPLRAGMTMGQFFDGLPKILKADELKAIARDIVLARQTGKPVIVMLGGHVIKTGCSPVLADLAANGYITHFASNGSAAIHDTELARFGHTSEDVAHQLEDGSFGMAADTAALINDAAKQAAKNKAGFGESVGVLLTEMAPPYLERALLAAAYRMKIPFTLHVAVGTDIVHQHADADGAAIGDAAMRDFRIFAHSISGLGDGGVVLNLGSAVIMPEVFLKALAVVRNLGHPAFGFTTANFDMIQHYRARANVIERPSGKAGKGYAVTGHHEIMIPLLAAAIYESTGLEDATD